jgi:hypothetical protein
VVGSIRVNSDAGAANRVPGAGRPAMHRDFCCDEDARPARHSCPILRRHPIHAVSACGPFGCAMPGDAAPLFAVAVRAVLTISGTDTAESLQHIQPLGSAFRATFAIRASVSSKEHRAWLCCWRGERRLKRYRDWQRQLVPERTTHRPCDRGVFMLLGWSFDAYRQVVWKCNACHPAGHAATTFSYEGCSQ